MLQRRNFTFLATALLASPWTRAQAPAAWEPILSKARGQTVYWNAWAGDEKTNAFIVWIGEQVKSRHGVNLVHTRLKDTLKP